MAYVKKALIVNRKDLLAPKTKRKKVDSKATGTGESAGVGLQHKESFYMGINTPIQRITVSTQN